MRWRVVLLLLGLVAVIGHLHFVMTKTPFKEEVLGDNYLIFFWHLPSAINLMVFFFLGLVFGIAYLRSQSMAHDARCQAAIEVGLIACTITMVTGSIWAKAAWGHWLVWDDPRLLSVSIMWLTYIAYLYIRQAIETPQARAKFGAIYAIIAFLNVPFVYYAINIIGRRSHPKKLDTSNAAISNGILFGLLAFFLLYLAIWWLASGLIRKKYRLDRYQASLEGIG